jgi:hypothetical protein
VQDLENSDFTTATFIYVTLKFHNVMEGYGKVKALATKVDSHESKLKLLVDKEKDKVKKSKAKKEDAES